MVLVFYHRQNYRADCEVEYPCKTKSGVRAGIVVKSPKGCAPRTLSGGADRGLATDSPTIRLVQIYLEHYFFCEWGPPKETKQIYEKRNKGKIARNLVCFPSDQAFERVQITVDIE
jgi:hypothetical protein